MSTEPAAKPIVRIEDWYLTRLGGVGEDRLAGTVYGHPAEDMPDGYQAITSELQSIDFARGIAETKRSIYHLGLRAP